MKKAITIFSFTVACMISVNAANKSAGEIKAESHNPGYDKVQVDSLASGAQLECSFTTGDLKANHTVELSIRAKKADGQYTKWKNAAYNPALNYDYTETSVMAEAVDRNILHAQKADGIYYKSHDADRDDKRAERTVTIAIPTFSDEAVDITQYELKIKYSNDCQTTGTCHWTIK